MRYVFWLPIWLCFAQPVLSDAVLIGRFVWDDPRPEFGGISAIHLAANGSDFVAVSDRALVMAGRFNREGGLIIAVTTGPLQHLTNPIGNPVSGRAADSEAIAVDAAGTVFIGFEGKTRIHRYDKLPGPATYIPIPGEFRGMQSNASIEALAIDTSGVLYAIPERSGRQTWPFPVFRYEDGKWDVPFDISRRGAFLVVGADVGPDGRLYVLERDFAGIGFRTRVRRFELDGQGEETLLQTDVTVHDNLEGISVWEDDAGLRMTLVSDDNFRRFQKTEIVEYRITD